jgi:hypothetical protein
MVAWVIVGEIQERFTQVQTHVKGPQHKVVLPIVLVTDHLMGENDGLQEKETWTWSKTTLLIQRL